jgi:hypothetical protein
LAEVNRAHKVSDCNNKAPLKLPYAIAITENLKPQAGEASRPSASGEHDDVAQNQMDHVNIGGYYVCEPSEILTEALFADDEELEEWET